MALLPSVRDDSRVFRLNRGERLSALERVLVLVFIGVVISLDVFGLIVSPGVDPTGSLLSIATSAVFALYLWSPWTATALLGVVLVLSFFADTESAALLAVAIAAGLILRLGWTALVLTYVVIFLLGSSVYAYGDENGAVNVGIYLVLATVAGAIGFALRMASARGRRYEQELAEKAEQERQAVLAERRWIAGELHDSIAHHLTVVALHVQMLDDPQATRGSQEAIRVAAKKAMTDLRFVIELADDGPRSSEVPTGDLTEAIDEARGEFESAGHAVVYDGDARDERLHRAAEIILARIVRESATNILKYAGPGEVTIALDIDEEFAALTISSPLPTTPRRDLSSSRTGLGRMAERVVGASGEFNAGEVDGHWRVEARLPLS